jgi:hypothetical protein
LTEHQPLTDYRIDQPHWTRRDFVNAGLSTACAVALGACAHTSMPRGSAAIGFAADLDDLGQSLHGRFLRDGSPGYDDARKVWNLAYDRHPLAMARCVDIDDVRAAWNSGDGTVFPSPSGGWP